jgi:hypothetical protein
MNAIQQHAQFSLLSDDSLFVTATLWRGSMIDRFAQIEFFINRTLANCAAASLVSKRDLAETLPRNRCKVLLNALDTGRPLGRFHAASRTLGAVFNRWDERNALCHGRMKMDGEGITFHWQAGGIDGLSEESIRLAPLQMLERLQSLDRLKTIVGSQLGSIDKFCAGWSN